jgi:hypothetical protein
VASGINSTMLFILASLSIAMVLSGTPALLVLPHIRIQKYPQKRNIILSKFTLTHFSPLLYLALIFVAPCGAELITSFSPGFIFIRPARGPPKITWKTKFNLHK